MIPKDFLLCFLSMASYEQFLWTFLVYICTVNEGSLRTFYSTFSPWHLMSNSLELSLYRSVNEGSLRTFYCTFSLWHLCSIHKRSVRTFPSKISLNEVHIPKDFLHYSMITAFSEWFSDLELGIKKKIVCQNP